MHRLYGLIGYPLEHSFSMQYFNAKFKQEGISATYKNFELKHLDDLTNVLQQHNDLCGFNVTMPYKQAIIPLLSDLDSSAQNVGAVNTIKVSNKGLIGYNTDVFGFEKLWNDNIKTKIHSAVILGNGGATKAVANVLKSKNISFSIASRNPKMPNHISYSQIWSGDNPFQVIINTTPVGMHPFCDDIPPIDTSKINDSHIVIDLIYNPSQTKFLQIAKSQGAKTINGLQMLVYQAEKAWNIWNEG
ncbi:MAG: shikimate dehydrogenase [Bacteroidales bacterium]|jgi:shikimate dehydrogenase|nr:shikimate dehydrogenase [Bacteroidales bacterium]